MAFFNLTALGPQNICQPKETFLYLFTPKDLETSFGNITHGGEETKRGEKEKLKSNMIILITLLLANPGLDRQIRTDEVFKLLSDLYRGPPPSDDWDEWKRALALDESSHFTLNDLTKALVKAQSKNPQGTVEGDVVCSSWTEYHDEASRHVRKTKGPKELFPSGPCTSSQDFGWKNSDAAEIPREQFARKSCPETDYASHLIKSGIV